MLIDCFRGLGTSLVEGCAGDFRPNAAECDRVHPSARQRASGACQSAQAEPWPIDRPKSTIDRLSKTNLAIDRPNVATDRLDSLLSSEIDILTRF